MSTFLTTLSEKTTTYAYNISLPDAPLHRRQKKRATVALLATVARSYFSKNLRF